MVEPEKVLFTVEQLRTQVNEPLIVVDLDRPIRAFELQKYHRLLHEAIASKCTVFVGTLRRPKLPMTDHMASIGFRIRNGIVAKVCLRLRDLYCTGVWLETNRFYEARSVSSPNKTVPDSIPLGRGDNYAELLGYKDEKPELDLNFSCLRNAYYEFLKLGTPKADYDKVLVGIAMTALIFIEPCRQAEIQELLVGAPGCYKSTVEYAILRSCKGTKWNVIQSWKKSCLVAEGLKRVNGVLTVMEDRSKCLEAQKQVLILLSNDYVHQM